MATIKKHHRTIAGEKAAAKIMRAIEEQQGEATVPTLGVQSSFMTRMLKAKLVKVNGKVKKPHRGQPAHMYTLTAKGRKLAEQA